MVEATQRERLNHSLCSSVVPSMQTKYRQQMQHINLVWISLFKPHPPQKVYHLTHYGISLCPASHSPYQTIDVILKIGVLVSLASPVIAGHLCYLALPSNKSMWLDIYINCFILVTSRAATIDLISIHTNYDQPAHQRNINTYMYLQFFRFGVYTIFYKKPD